MEREFRRYLDCGILAHGFAHPLRGLRTRLPDRFLLQGTRRLPIVPRLPVRQWVLAVPKRRRYFLERDADQLSLSSL